MDTQSQIHFVSQLHLLLLHGASNKDGGRSPRLRGVCGRQGSWPNCARRGVPDGRPCRWLYLRRGPLFVHVEYTDLNNRERSGAFHFYQVMSPVSSVVEVQLGPHPKNRGGRPMRRKTHLAPGSIRGGRHAKKSFQLGDRCMIHPRYRDRGSVEYTDLNN